MNRRKLLMIIRKRQLLLATLVIALGSAVFVNWYYTGSRAQTVGENVLTPTAITDGVDSANLGDARYVISSDITTLAVSNTNADGDEYFASAKLRRSAAHDEACEALNDIIKDSTSSASAVSQASELLNELTRALTLEADIENLVSAKVGGGCLVIINGGNAEVIVENGVLNDSTIVQIKEIAVKQTGYPAEKITILELNG